QDRAAVSRTSHLLLMNGTDHHGPQAQLPGLLRTLDDRFREEGARLLHSRLPDYVGAVRQEVGAGEGLPVRRGELREVNRSGSEYSNFLLYGVASARTPIKQANHEAQQALERYAEPWATVAWLLGAPYPQGALTQSWKYLLQNHPHDSICGCSLDEVHEQMMTRFQWSREIAGQVATEALHQINRRAARPSLEEGEVAFRLVNPLPWAREEVWEAAVDVPLSNARGAGARAFQVLDGAGTVLPHVLRGDQVLTRTLDHSDVQPAPRNLRVRALRLAFRATLPALGYGTFVLRPLALPAWDRDPAGPASVQVTAASLENEHLRVVVGSNGTLDLTHKASGRTYSGLLLFESGGDVGDEYTFSPPQRDRVLSTLGCPATVAVEEEGPLTGRLRIDLTLTVPEGAAEDRKSRAPATVDLRLSSTVTLAAGSQRLEVLTEVHNVARDHRLRVHFPLGVRAERHAVDQAFDVVQRPNDYPWTPAAYWSEDPPQTHPQRLFVDLADEEGGLALLNQGIAEYGITGEPGGPRGLALTLLRCVAFLGGAQFPNTIRSGAGPHIATPGAQCQGRHQFRYALVPHNGNWAGAGLLREANAFCAPALSYPVEDASESPGPTSPLGLSERFLEVVGVDEPDGAGIMVSAVKRAEAPDEREGGSHEGRVIVRLYNPTGREREARIRLRGGFRAAWRTNILEALGESLPVGADGLRLTLAPGKILTVALEPE
ncbi:MAG TPA: glycoside hydrolase family 38 C-terminal domain-containing protein, partial [Chloroflexota bacterium]|nr:glycoside hydrolase family 38 C-terminal domain-containing protein [Chloroflexota bacterium]